MTVMSPVALLLSSVVLTGWFVACGSPSPESAPTPSDQNDLTGTVWRLVEFQGSDDTRLTPDDPAKYTIEFGADGRLNARLDCNRGRGTWKSSGPGLELGPLALTRAACPPGSLHDRMVKHWPYIRSYVLKDGDLFLALMADGGIYQFEPASDAVPPSGAKLEGTEATLENTEWTLRALGGQPVRTADDISAPHLLLDGAQTRASGSTSCNQFSGSYRLRGDSLRFGELISTLRACVDPELNRQEQAFLDALAGTRTWRVTGDSLVLSGEAEPVAHFGAERMK